MKIPKIALKSIYNFILVGLPITTYSPLNDKSIFHAPAKILESSTYINYRLEDENLNIIEKYIKDYNEDFSLIKTRIASEKKGYYLSINIYNCTSPIFQQYSSDPVSRCEINTYVKNSKGEEGTLIIDYTSNYLSMDPVNVFKKNGICNYKSDNNKYKLSAKNKNFELLANFRRDDKRDVDIPLNPAIIGHTDNCFYLNGIYDKLYYDSSLVRSSIRIPRIYTDIKFKFLDIEFDEIDSIFYFRDSLNFVGAIWKNLYDS